MTDFNDYIEKRSFEELVQGTAPMPQYEYVVKDILRDKAYDWRPNYYADYAKTSWDLAVCRAAIRIKELEAGLKANKELLASSQTKIQRSRLEPTDKNYLKISKKEHQAIDLAYATATDEIGEQTQELEELLPKQDEQLWKQSIERRTGMTLRQLRNKFQIDGDEDFMRRGVTWALSYSYKQLGLAQPEYKPDLLSAW
jgi:hypothetical protein